MTTTHAVTGAFGYSGRAITRQLLERGHRVVTLTNSPHHRRSSDPDLRVMPLDFAHPQQLVRSLRGVDVLHNTYWVRFNHRHFNHQDAVRNTITLFQAARDAGVGRIVHVSITNPDRESPLEYFRGKARLEEELQATGISHAILRPAVLFGGDDVLINNIAWFLRHFPVFGVLGDGTYQLQPIHVEDFAALAVAHADHSEDQVVSAIGPETFTFRELAVELARALGISRPIVSVPPWIGQWVTRAVGWLVGDVVLTAEEIRGLMANTLVVEAEPTGHTRLTEWAREHREQLGRVYASELARRQASRG